MAEQTEKAFLKQPKVFLSSKRPGKGGNRFYKSIGLNFKTPREAIEAEAKEYMDNNRDEYGSKKAILHVLSNRVNDAGLVVQRPTWIPIHTSWP
ncbi:hypothetical protein IFM89_001855 [Coptis chinensis]|uniref:Small ribosomal subunit protein uS17 N-terminal domain-containing protein n=1 Tax=Coptis chinensis TaxID=261450 RepID=A0A835HI64_9MAGN|nr:hypothetical protein IFM89_001855 [Coptis chinensis]